MAEVSPEPTETATVEVEPTDTPPPTPPPTLEAPPLPQGVQSLGDGSVALEIAPGERQFVAPLELAEAFGQPPACAGFAFVFSWRMEEDASVRFEGQLRGATIQIAEGVEGTFTSDCVVLEAVNDGSETIRGTLRYVVGEFQ